MKKNRLLLLLNVSVVALAPTAYAQDVTERVQDADGVTKQQLEEFLTQKTADTGSHDAVAQGPSDAGQPVERVTSEIPSLASVKEEQADHQEPEAQNQSATQQSMPTQEKASQVDQADQVAPTQSQVPAQAELPANDSADKSVPKEIEAPITTKPFSPLAQPAAAELSVTQEPETTPSAPAEVAPSAPIAAPVVSAPPSIPAQANDQAPVVAQEEEQPEESLLDTIDIQEGGNWVLKRKALQDTVRKIEDINALYDDIRDTNIVFLQGINTVDVLFTQFSYDVGLDLGKVDQLVQDVAHHLESERDHAGDLSKEERELLDKAELRKKEIEQLRSNIHDIWLAHDQLKEARGLNDEQIIEADRLRKQAWRNFRMIERVLNEVKAEELYHETVQLFEAMQTSYRYLQTRLIPHFEASIKIIQEKMKTVKQQAEELQNQGVLLKEQTKDLSIKDQEEDFEDMEIVVRPTTGWFGTVKSILWAPFGALGSIWNWLTGSSDDMKKYLPDEAEGHETNDSETKQPDEL